jgi:hypothetical protein
MIVRAFFFFPTRQLMWVMWQHCIIAKLCAFIRAIEVDMNNKSVIECELLAERLHFD